MKSEFMEVQTIMTRANFANQCPNAGRPTASLRDGTGEASGPDQHKYVSSIHPKRPLYKKIWMRNSQQKLREHGGEFYDSAKDLRE